MHESIRDKYAQVIYAWIFDAFEALQQIPIKIIDDKLCWGEKEENIEVTGKRDPNTNIKQRSSRGW